MTAPLAHLRVVDLTDLRGALAGRILADLGADVVKVEPPGGDRGRLTPPFAGDVAGPDRSLPFLFRNANKRGMVLDLHADDGWRAFGELCQRADILLENLGPEAQHRHGLAPTEVRVRHPRLIHVALADFGADGPCAAWRAEPLAAFAASGALYASGFADRPPCWVPGFLAHDCGSIFAVAGALAAVLDRARHGQGQTVEVSVQEAALAGLNPWSIPLADYARHYPMLPTAPPRNADGSYYVLPTADGYVRVLPASPRQWRAWVRLIGQEEALGGPEWELPIFRLLNADVIRLLATQALAPRPRAQVLAEARRLDVPLVPVNSPDDFVAEEQTRVRGYFQRTGFPHVEAAPFAPFPVRLAATPAVLAGPAPAPGASGGPWGASDATDPPCAPDGGPMLAGMRVVNLGVGAVGPEIAGLLGDLGAEVIKVESEANIDFLRRVTVEADTPNRSWSFNVEGRGQESVCLDLRTAHGRELALALCARADVVVENNRGGVVESVGLDYPDVRRVNPGVIYIASQGFGRGGPLGTASAFGPLNSTFAGVNWLWNHPEAPYPGGTSLNHPDHIASRLGAVAVLAALEHRRRTGEGQFLEMAQTEAAAYLQGEVYLETACTGHGPVPRGNASRAACPHGVYPCAGDERWCAIVVHDDDAWRRFVAAVGWPDDPALATVAGRLAGHVALDERVAAWTRRRGAEEVAALLQAAGVSAMVVQNADDHRVDAHLTARGAIVTVEHPEVGPERHVRNPIRLGRTPLMPERPAPLLGQHTAAVLARVLGLEPSDIARLVTDGVCR